MRSLAEIRFRIRQELKNPALFCFPPKLSARTTPAPVPLPAVEPIVSRLENTDFARGVQLEAEAVLGHRFSALGYVFNTGPEPHWRRDYVHGQESGLQYFRRIPYLDAARAGDHKAIWELSRHQHLVLLAQAYLFSRREELLTEISRLLESWWAQNPFMRGINWTSALEVAFRALSWIWLDHLAGPQMPDALRRRLHEELYRHGTYLENNLSVYFSPNTHLLGEAVALHAIGKLFPSWPRSARWRSMGKAVVHEQMMQQVREDGSHFEQSTAYHVYSLDLLLFHAILEPPGGAYLDRLGRMADYLAAITAPDGRIPLLGDDDGGRVFHPFGDRRRFGAATLATCAVFLSRWDLPWCAADLSEQAAWWLGASVFPAASSVPEDRPDARAARLFAGAGVALIAPGPVHILADVNGFGYAGAGHSHAHALNVVCSRDGKDILFDPGTYTYVSEPQWRDWFRGTAAHNTVRVNGMDQADPAGPFRWANKPLTRILQWHTDSGSVYLAGSCQYRNVHHQRHWLWVKAEQMLLVVDFIDGLGADVLEQFWHCGGPVQCAGSDFRYEIGDGATILFPGNTVVQTIESWQSETPGRREPRTALRIQSKQPVFGAAICFGTVAPGKLSLTAADDHVRMDGEGNWSAIFHRSAKLASFVMNRTSWK